LRQNPERRHTRHRTRGLCLGDSGGLWVGATAVARDHRYRGLVASNGV